jgi:hypothetical protein
LPHKARGEGSGKRLWGNENRAASDLDWSPTVDFMMREGIPVTRENDLALNFPEGMPEDFGYELEACRTSTPRS